jgi:hypothetical protein
MKFETTYDVDVATKDASIRQMLYAIRLKPKLWGLVVLSICTLLSFLAPDLLGPSIRWEPLVLMVFVTMLWIKSYYSLISTGRKTMELSSSPSVCLRLSSEEIEFISSNGTRKHSWTKIDRVLETKDFLLVMSGKLCLFCIPKRHLPADIQEYIKKAPNKGTAHL